MEELGQKFENHKSDKDNDSGGSLADPPFIHVGEGLIIKMDLL